MHAFRLVFGIFTLTLVACGASSSPSKGSDTNGPETKPDGGSTGNSSTAKADGGWLPASMAGESEIPASDAHSSGSDSHSPRRGSGFSWSVL